MQASPKRKNIVFAFHQANSTDELRLTVQPPLHEAVKGETLTVTFVNYATCAVEVWIPSPLADPADQTVRLDKKTTQPHRQQVSLCTDYVGDYVCDATPIAETCPFCSTEVEGGVKLKPAVRRVACSSAWLSGQLFSLADSDERDGDEDPIIKINP